MNKQELSALIAELLQNMEPAVKASDYKPQTPGPEPHPGNYHDGDFVEDVTELDLRKLYLVTDGEKPQEYRVVALGTGKNNEPLPGWAAAEPAPGIRR